MKGWMVEYHHFLIRALPVKKTMAEAGNWFGTNTDITNR
jgi:hypothetical protein